MAPADFCGATKCACLLCDNMSIWFADHSLTRETHMTHDHCVQPYEHVHVISTKIAILKARKSTVYYYESMLSWHRNHPTKLMAVACDKLGKVDVQKKPNKLPLIYKSQACPALLMILCLGNPLRHRLLHVISINSVDRNWITTSYPR